MATIRELADYYVTLLASIYETKYKASNTTALFAKQLLADNLIAEFGLGFDLDTAVGAQLDILGKYIGAPRDVGIEDTRPFFGFVDYDYPAGDQNLNGFVLYESIAVNASGIWYEYGFSGQATTALTDFQYRQLMKLKISTNSTENTMAAIQNQIEDFFSGQLQLRDNKDMTLTYFYGTSFQLPLSVLEAYLPRPMGVGVTAVEAIGFDVTVDGEPAFNSETPSPMIAFGPVTDSLAKTIVITNAKTSEFTIIAIVSNSVNFVVSAVTPSLPATLESEENLQFTLTATGTESVEATGMLEIFINSSAGLSSYQVDLSADITITPLSGGSIEFPFSTAGATIPIISAYTLGDFTFEFWLNVKSSPINQGYGRVFDNDYLNGFDINIRAGSPRLWFECSEIGSSFANPLDTFTDVVYDGWGHYAFVREGSTGKIFRNAVADRVLAMNSTPFTPTGPTLSIGSKGAELASGYISDWRLWNVARTQAQIAATYQTRLVGNETGLVAYYKLNQTNEVFADATGNNVPFTKNGCVYSTVTPPCFPI